MMMSKKNCLYCYKSLTNETDFHEKCALDFFETKEAPKIPYSLDDMGALAQNIVERSIAVPGVQPKLSMSLVTDSKTKETPRFTVVGALGGHYIFKPPTPQFRQMPENEHLTIWKETNNKQIKKMTKQQLKQMEKNMKISKKYKLNEKQLKTKYEKLNEKKRKSLAP